MARTAGRSADETRQLILTSAARLIGRHGTTVPVTDIAEAAGVSHELEIIRTEGDVLTGS